LYVGERLRESKQNEPKKFLSNFLGSLQTETPF